MASDPTEYDQTHWAPVQRRQPLPTFYYHQHFVELLDFVQRHYAHVLLDRHVRYLTDFRSLSVDAQRLYVRLVNRKGSVFARNKLRYPEIGDLGPVVDELRAGEWVGSPAPKHFAEMLGFLTRGQIYDVVLPRFAGISRSLRKADLVAFALENVEPSAFVAGVGSDQVVVQHRHDETRFLMYLYFGRIQDSLSQFTMRDLGLVRTQDAADGYEPRYGDREEALEHYYFATRLHAARKADAGQLSRLWAELGEWPEPVFAGSAALRDDLAYKLGREAERADEPDTALALYRAGESAACSEKVARLMFARGDKEEAREYLERCIDEPRSDEEWLVASDLYERKFRKKRTTVMTDLLRAADVVDIDESRSGAPERAVIEYFESLGHRAFRTENLFWRTLFGLTFWEELFDGAESHSPFERLPAALSNGTFHEQYADAIEAKLEILADRASVKRSLLKVSTSRYGTPNGVFRWRRSMLDAVFALIDAGDPDALAAVLRTLCTDFASARYGYPDLMVVDGDGVKFVEVKTEGDQLRRNQLLKIAQLREAGFRADVLRVRWVLDPDQDYVVVDVETTGGRGDKHRVTEIGAVKVRGGHVVDRFETLINPQRAIPAGITRLTGINQEMVADAPYFFDVADEFESFMHGAIFVAHNVEFDYGFIASEFRRIGRGFRHPKLCTCASMRRLYPGHRSYSLAALCREYDIPLKSHHRALCDAEAAAELLLLVNEKRVSAQAS
ncbi:MAG: exonuclease domain-containing protein [Woeseiaceae bacterium]|nr:exonuclease domain-containing protein [Woeseiaceae bacterium]